MRIYRAFLTILASALLSGCITLGRKSPTPTKEEITEQTVDGVTTIIRTTFQQDYAVLNVIGGLCAVLAVGGIIAAALGLRPPIRLVVTLVLCAMGAWTARYMLHEYMWLFAAISVVGILLAGVGITLTHIRTIERLLGVDINRDGKVGP